jgi:hypothetical protein
MDVAMPRRLKKFLPIVLIALAVQVFTPIASCWAASIAASDPLSVAVICHGNGGISQDDPSGAQGPQSGCCSLCGTLHTGVPVDPPTSVAVLAFEPQVTSVVWRELELDPATSRAGSPEQARAPPSHS